MADTYEAEDAQNAHALNNLYQGGHGVAEDKNPQTRSDLTTNIEAIKTKAEELEGRPDRVDVAFGKIVLAVRLTDWGLFALGGAAAEAVIDRLWDERDKVLKYTEDAGTKLPELGSVASSAQNSMINGNKIAQASSDIDDLPDNKWPPMAVDDNSKFDDATVSDGTNRWSVNTDRVTQ
ncbi:hypothetical protein [Nocardia shimofusensis]|uniref:hypothetical protein n=1 Tax=Nocardia shimofusensis TaxID=228596 RepID=UPI0012ED8D86|nr:hypothetical protein [Nocardia shimofusensis]